MATAMSKAFKVLDPMRELLDTLLGGWVPPAIIVVGDESSGKSTVLEQLAMLSVFPRKRRFCTRMTINVRLRRSHDEPSLTTLTVIDVASGRRESDPEKIPLA